MCRSDTVILLFVLKLGGLPMNRTKMTYFKEEDVLHLAISDEKEAGSVEPES